MSKKNKKPTTSFAPKGVVEPSVVSQWESIERMQRSAAGFWANTRLQAILIFAVSFLLYANTLTHDFCQDDAIVITDNMFTTEGVSGIPGIMGYDTFYGFFKDPNKANLVAGGRYRPFTLVMFAFEYQIFGKNPFIGHLMNVLLFGLTSVLLYFLLLKLLNYKASIIAIGDALADNSAAIIAFIAVLFFAAHPIHTEAVANIKGRDEIMTLLGSLAAVWFSLKFYENKGISNQIIPFALFFIALLSKENAITFVVIVPLIYWFFMQTDWSTAFKQAMPFAAAAVFFMILRGAVIGNQFRGEQNELMNNPYLKLVGNQYVPFEAGEKMATIIYTLGKYIQLLIFPHPLTHDYYPRHIGIMQFSDWQVLLSLAVYVGLVALSLRGIAWQLRGDQKRDVISFGLAFFLITLSIVSNVVFPVGTNMAERFMFMPSVGFCLVLAVILMKYLKNYAIYAAVGITVLFGIKTFTRNFDWKDNYTIFTTDVNVSQNSAKLQCSAGGAMIEKAATETNSTLKKEQLNAAIGHLRRSLEIHPTYKNPYLLLGNAYIYLENFEKAIEEYQNGLKLDPQFKDIKTNLALAYREMGRIYGQQKNDLPKAIEYLEKAVEYNPKDGQAYSNLGTCYGLTGQTQKAIDALERALAIRFDKNDAVNLSTAYRIFGNIAKAEEWANKGK